VIFGGLLGGIGQEAPSRDGGYPKFSLQTGHLPIGHCGHRQRFPDAVSGSLAAGRPETAKGCFSLCPDLNRPVRSRPFSTVTVFLHVPPLW
jgi:hypothetical protein